MLVEKYRPQSFDDKNLVITKTIQQIIDRTKKGDIPHMLFCGNAGLGKTTIAFCIVRHMNNDNTSPISKLCLNLNASDDRGIDIVRGRIKEYAKMMSLEGKKLIFLDEVDALTWDAQNALRRTMEDFHKNCIFILSANYENKIIQPIKSRCAVYRFEKATVEEAFRVIKRIAEKEDINITDDALNEILKQSSCDLRASINLLDSLSGNIQIGIEDIKVKSITEALLNIIEEQSSLEMKIPKFQELLYKGSPKVTIQELFTIVSTKYSKHEKFVEIIKLVADKHYKILALSQTDGILQLLGLCIELCRYLGLSKTEIKEHSRGDW